jgi:type II secretory pathway pseudopilin PulG
VGAHEIPFAERSAWKPSKPRPSLRSGTRHPAAGGTKRRGFTLLELILALGLTVIVVGLVGMAVSTQLRLAASGRAHVQEAQLARALLHRIAEDLHNAVPYSTDPPQAPEFSGSINQLELAVCRTVAVSPAAAVAAAQDPTVVGRALDVRTVFYYLGEPSDLIATEDEASGPAAGGPAGGGLEPAGGSGLIRTEASRAVAAWAAQQGGSDPTQLGPATVVPEVVDIQFSYYDGTGTENDEWDSQQQQGLPYAVKVGVTMRRPSQKPVQVAEGPSDDRAQFTVYSLLVPLANAAPTGTTLASTQQTSDASDAGSGSGGTSGGTSAGGKGEYKGKDEYKGKGKGEYKGKGKGEYKGKGKGEYKGKGKGEYKGKGKGEYKGKGEGGRGRGGGEPPSPKSGPAPKASTTPNSSSGGKT